MNVPYKFTEGGGAIFPSLPVPFPYPYPYPYPYP